MASFKGKAPQKIFRLLHCALREPQGATVHFHYKLRGKMTFSTVAASEPALDANPQRDQHSAGAH
jgi:hypothetical protein